MNTWKNLPVEILDLLFCTITHNGEKIDHATKTILIQCQLTCKKWSDHARRHVFRSVVIKSSNEFIDLLATLNTSKSNLEQYVKYVTVLSWTSTIPRLGLLRLLLVKCPNIEKLDVSPDISGNIFVEIQAAWERGSCRRLERTPLYTQKDISNVAAQQYQNAMYCLRDKLQNLILYEMFIQYVDGPNLQQQHNLKSFPKLLFLTIQTNDMHALFRITSYIEACPRVKRVSLDFYRKPNPGANKGLDIQSIAPCSTVKVLELYYFRITEEKALEYIIRAFPNLDCFTMEISHGELERPSIPNARWVQFLGYISRVKSYVHVQRLYFVDMANILAHYFATRESNKSLQIVYPAFNNYVPTPYIDINHWKIETSDAPILSISFSRNSNSLPFIQLLRKTGGFLKSLEFLFDCRRVGFFLDHVFQHCTILSDLTIKYLTLTEFHSETQSASITHLTLINCDISQEAFPSLSTAMLSLSHLVIKNHRRVESNGDPYRSPFGYNYEEGCGNIYANGHHFGGPFSYKNLPRKCRNYIIKMSNTSFDTFIWEKITRSSTDESFDLNLKVITPTKSYYYIGHQDSSLSESSDVLFQKYLDLKSSFTMYIQCQDIKKLSITFNRLLWQIDFTDLDSIKKYIPSSPFVFV